MPKLRNFLRTSKKGKNLGLSQFAIAGLVVVVLGISVAIVYWSQAQVERDAFALRPHVDTSALKARAEIAKLVAEVRQIRSDTAGSLFWLKMIALFVTVGGAVGGYLVGQSRTNQARIAFENRKNVDAVYQSLVQELSNEAAVLRAAAAVKLGAILESFPAEWDVGDDRRDQLIKLTKQVLAASLAIERDEKVLKMLTRLLHLEN